MTPLYDRIVKVIQQIPTGKVATYGQIAHLAGNPRASRTVSFVLHSSSSKLKLPWHRVINSKGSISLPKGGGFEKQRDLLLKEGIALDEKGHIDLKRYGWKPVG